MESMKGNKLIPQCYTVDQWNGFTHEERIRELRLSAVCVANNTSFSKRERQLCIDAISDEIEYYKNVSVQIEGFCK